MIFDESNGYNFFPISQEKNTSVGSRAGSKRKWTNSQAIRSTNTRTNIGKRKRRKTGAGVPISLCEIQMHWPIPHPHHNKKICGCLLSNDKWKVRLVCSIFWNNYGFYTICICVGSRQFNPTPFQIKKSCLLSHNRIRAILVCRMQKNRGGCILYSITISMEEVQDNKKLAAPEWLSSVI